MITTRGQAAYLEAEARGRREGLPQYAVRVGEVTIFAGSLSAAHEVMDDYDFNRRTGTADLLDGPLSIERI